MGRAGRPPDRGWSRAGFAGADEGAGHGAVQGGDGGFGVDVGWNRPGDGGVVGDAGDVGAVEDVGGLDVGGLEAGGVQFGLVVGVEQGAGDAAGPQCHEVAQRCGQPPAEHDVGDGEPAAGAQYPVGLAQDAVLVHGEVDDAVGDDDVDRGVRQRDVLDRAVQEFGVGDAGLVLVAAGQVQHLGSEVPAVGLAGGPDPAGGEQDVDAAAGAEVEDGFAGVQVGAGGGGVVLADRVVDLVWTCRAHGLDPFRARSS